MMQTMEPIRQSIYGHARRPRHMRASRTLSKSNPNWSLLLATVGQPGFYLDRWAGSRGLTVLSLGNSRLPGLLYPG